MQSYQALYYPYIHFKNDAWVKLSALYWDKIKRIAPDSYRISDSADVRALGSFVETISPGTADRAFGETLVEFLTVYGDEVRNAYALDNLDRWPVVSPARPLPSDTADPRLGYVRREKINSDLYWLLEQDTLAVADRKNGDWIGMHPRLASVYMHALAEHIAERSGLRPLTDETFDHLALSQLSLERLANALLGDVALVGAAPTATEVETTLVSVAFRTLVPINLENLSVDKVIAFRETYPAERARFQSAVDSLLRDRQWLLSINDPKALQERLQDEVEVRWGQELTQLKAKLDDIGIATLFGRANLTTALPSAVTCAIGMLGVATNGVAAGAAAVALSAIPMLLSRRKAEQAELDKSSVNYLLRMERGLKPADLQGWWRNGLRRLVAAT